ncbi:hypothetical protein [Ammoniphilus sp. CFH 90114]|uniref:hypothetical protein n=1 Tax=Ammoniphilus sp. CFH 90114 TaxID=2493665 RepID=UPI00100DF803|nr:hypothetical protein [Ammoniphilus sp. CFH 90114]RXT05217.1 hypothetical protein EIZ39_17675 [Ammoniphilus sp. CFH 90114]
MRQESAEKKIIESLQQYTSPGPDPAFEARLKAEFLQEARETSRKRKFFRRVAWSGTIAASLLVGVMAYQNDLIGWINNQDNHMANIDPSETMPNQTLTMQMDSWETIDTNQLELLDQDYEGRHNLALYTTPDRKKLYAVIENRGVLLYETEKTQIITSQSYPFPNQQGQFYIWFLEDEVLVPDKEIKRDAHVLLFKADGTFAEVANLPQPGYDTTHTMEWSPAGNQAYLAMENRGEWIVGQLLEDELTFKPLYGQITKQSNEVSTDIPEQRANWEVAWVSDEELLVYNPGSHAFYGVNTQNQSAWEYREILLPKFSKGQYVKDISVPVNENPRVAIVKVGSPVFDVSFHGTEKLYAVHLDQGEFLPVDNLVAQSKSRLYDQYHFNGPNQGEKQLIGSVYTVDQKTFGMRFGIYHLPTNQYESFFETDFNEPVALDGQTKLSPDGKLAAFRVHGFPPESVAKMYLYVVDLESGKEVIPPIEKEYIGSYEFQQDGTLKVDDEIIPLKK